MDAIRRCQTTAVYRRSTSITESHLHAFFRIFRIFWILVFQIKAHFFSPAYTFGGWPVVSWASIYVCPQKTSVTLFLSLWASLSLKERTIFSFCLLELCSPGLEPFGVFVLNFHLNFHCSPVSLGDCSPYTVSLLEKSMHFIHPLLPILHAFLLVSAFDPPVEKLYIECFTLESPH